MVPYVLGEEEVLLGFALIGVAGCVAENREDALREFKAVAESSERVLLLVTEAVASWIGQEIRNAVLGGAMVQVIAGVHPPGGRREEEEAMLLSALGIRL